MYSSEHPSELAHHPVAQADKTRLVSPGRLRVGSQRSIVFVSPPGTIPDCIIEAVEREFPRLQVEHIPDIEDIGADFGQPVGLFLVDSAFLPRLDEQIGRCQDLHRHAMVAVTFDDIDSARAELPLICRSDFLRGVLPMNLKLDVWLSAVALLLRGGEYAPASLLRNCLQGHLFGRSGVAETIVLPHDAAREAQDVALDELTERELEILEHVAQGTQNKVIASELGLSEHTVKIHIHNIIRKLRVRNRTEAAAVFLQSSMSAGERVAADGT